MYADTNKTNYRKLCLQNGKVLFDSEPSVRKIFAELRSYTETGKPCTGSGYDYCNKKVTFE